MKLDRYELYKIFFFNISVGGGIGALAGVLTGVNPIETAQVACVLAPSQYV